MEEELLDSGVTKIYCPFVTIVYIDPVNKTIMILDCEDGEVVERLEYQITQVSILTRTSEPVSRG